jgi:hypothetical protein
MRRLRQRGKNIRDLVEPAALLSVGGEHLAQRTPEPERAVAHRQDWGAHPATFRVAQQVRPGPGRLPMPVTQGDQLLGAVRADPDQDQQAQPLLLEADVHVDPVGPHVHVVHPRQVPR